MHERFVRPVLIIIAAALIVWIILWTAYSNLKKRQGADISTKRAVMYFLFYSYIIGVLSLTVLPLPFYRFKGEGGGGINLVPFISIVKGVLEIFTDKKVFTDNFQNVVGNVILFIPLGIFVPLLWSKYRSPTKLALLACICSASIELTQLLLRHFEIYRVVDINDVVLNTGGGVLGYVILEKSKFVKKRLRWRIKGSNNENPI